MGRIVKIFLGVVVLLIAVVVAGVAYVASLDKNDIASLITDQTGRKVDISGDFKLEILTLTPSVTVEGLTIANAGWGSRPEMIKLGRFATQVELMPLLSGDVRVKYVVLEGLDVMAETDAKGLGNWVFGPSVAKEEEKAGAVTVPVVEKVQLKDVRVVYKDGATGEQIEVILDNLDVSSKDQNSPVIMALAGSFNSAPYTASGEFGAVKTLLLGGRPYPIKLVAEVLGAKLTVSGSIAKPREVEGMDLKVSVEGIDLTQTAGKARRLVPALKDMTVPPVGPFRIAASIKGSQAAPAISGLDVSIGQTDKILITASGGIEDAINIKGVDITVAAKGPDLTATIGMAKPFVPALKDIAIPDIGPYDVAATVKGSLEALSVTGLKADIGRKGTLQITAKGGIEDAINVKGVDITVAVKGSDLTATIGMGKPFVPALKKMTIPDIGPYDVALAIKGSLDALTISNLAANIGREGTLQITAKGGIEDAINVKGVDITVAAKGPDLTATIGMGKPFVPALKEMTIPDIGPYDVAATLKGSLEALAVTSLNVNIGRAKNLLVTASGGIEDAINVKGLDLTVGIRGDDISGFSDLAQTELPDLPPFTLAAKINDQGGAYNVQDLNVTIGRSDLQGSVSVALGGQRPVAKADLTSTLLDLDQMLPKGKGKPAAPAAKKKSDGRVFPADPLPLEGLQAADANLAFSGKRIVSQGVKIDNVSVVLSLKNGRLDIKPLKALVSGGAIDGTVVLDSGKPIPDMVVDLKVNQFDYGAFLKQMGQDDLLRGKVDLVADIKGQGGSVRAIMAGLDGKVDVISQNGKIDSKLLNIVSADVLSAFPGVDSKGDKDLRCLVVRFDVSKGQATGKAILLETGGLTMIGTGGINLAAETLKLRFDPRAKKKSLLKAAIPFEVGGTLASPSVTPDMTAVATGAVKTVTGAAMNTVTGVAKGGAGLLGSVLGGGKQQQDTGGTVDETDYCALALAGKPLVASKITVIKPAAPAPQPAAQPTTTTNAPLPPPPGKKKGTVDKTIEDISKGVGGALKGLFGN